MKLEQFLEQYRIETQIRNDIDYKQVTVSKYSGIKLRGIKNGSKIGRKRQFLIDLEKYPNTLIFTRQGLLNGSLGLASKEVHHCVLTENMPTFSVNTDIIDVNFLKYLIRSNFFLNKIKELTVVGSAQKSIHERDFLKIDIDIPSIDKQKKIVKKISLKSKFFILLKDEIHNQNQLFSKLKQSILQEAIQGKLSKNWREENQNIETVSKLLERVKAEKEQLIFDKKIKKEKPLPLITNEQIPFELPDKWVWCRLGNVGFAQTGTTPPKNDNSNFDDYIPFIQPGNISENGLSFNCISLSEKGLLKSRLIQKYSNMMVCIGGSSGKTCFNKVDVACNQQINTITAYSNISYKYLDIVLKSSYFQKSVWSNIKQGSTPVLNKTRWTNIPIPIAPFQEQKVIVSKIELLMQKCDQLKEEIKKNEANAEMLTQSLLKEAFDNQ
tara:strand:+ start:1215 stop:2531 length:1317 start_codon:yes stop_codon:yes gene_type:complete